MTAFVALPDLWVLLQSAHVLKDSGGLLLDQCLRWGLPEMPSEPTQASLPPRPSLHLRLTLSLCAGLFCL